MAGLKIDTETDEGGESEGSGGFTGNHQEGDAVGGNPLRPAGIEDEESEGEPNSPFQKENKAEQSF